MDYDPGFYNAVPRQIRYNCESGVLLSGWEPVSTLLSNV